MTEEQRIQVHQWMGEHDSCPNPARCNCECRECRQCKRAWADAGRPKPSSAPDDDLDAQLKQLCDSHGWSYPGARPLVERLFNSIAIREATIGELRGELTRFRLELEAALGDHYEQGRDGVQTVKDLVAELQRQDPERKRERDARWAEILRAVRDRDVHTRRGGYRAAAAEAHNIGVEFREALTRLWKKL